MIIKFDKKPEPYKEYVKENAWDQCSTCRSFAKHPLTGERYDNHQNVLFCNKCKKSFIPKKFDL